MNRKPLIVTGHGRSGTHWLAYLMSHFFDAYHEPEQIQGDIVVDCRLRSQAATLQRSGHRVMHLVRDGREVVRSTDAFYKGRHDFAFTCEMWADAVNLCRDFEFVRLEDIIRKAAYTQHYTLPHWTDWTEEQTETFWRICGEGMARHGYER